MHRQLGDASFADVLLPENVGRNAPLEQLDAVLDWEPLAEVVRDLYAAPAGRPRFPPLLMVRCCSSGSTTPWTRRSRRRSGIGCGFGASWSCGSSAWPTTCGARADCRRWPVANLGSVRRSYAKVSSGRGRR